MRFRGVLGQVLDRDKSDIQSCEKQLCHNKTYNKRPISKPVTRGFKEVLSVTLKDSSFFPFVLGYKASLLYLLDVHRSAFCMVFSTTALLLIFSTA